MTNFNVIMGTFFSNIFKNIISYKDYIAELIGFICFIILVFLFVSYLLNFISTVNKKTLKQIENFKLNGKYIENLFIELNDTKEFVRYFVYGAKWKNKVINSFNNAYDNYYGTIIKKAMINICSIYKLYFYNKLSYVRNIINTHLNIYNDEELRNKVIQDYEEFFHIGTYTYKYQFELLNDHCNAMTHKNLLLIGTAGNGKTNLLCNVAQLTVKTQNPTLLLNSRDINKNLLDYFIDCLKIPHLLYKHKEWILTLLNVLFNIMHKKFFIIIDAINENDDNSFKNSLSDFTNYINNYNSFRIILTCRKEYFDYRYDNLLNNKTNYDFLIYDIKASQYSERAIRKIFSVYKKHFNYTPDIPKLIQEKLSADLILMRIFFEVYQNTNTPVKSLNKFEIYQKYITNISNTCNNVHKIIDSIVKTMLSKEKYDDIPVVDLTLTKMEIEDFKKFADENIIISRVIKENQNSLIQEEKEVVYFVFDEFRDYCLARQIILNCERQEDKEYKALFNILTKMQSDYASPYEGIIRYSYEHFKKTDKILFCKAILEEHANLSVFQFRNRRQTIFLNDDENSDFNNFGLSLIFNTDFKLLDFEKIYIFQTLAHSIGSSDYYLFIKNLLHNEKYECGFSLFVFIEFILQLDEYSLINSILGNLCELEYDGNRISDIYYDLEEIQKHFNWSKLIILLYCYNKSLKEFEKILLDDEKLDIKICQLISDTKCERLKEIIINTQKIAIKQKEHNGRKI